MTMRPLAKPSLLRGCAVTALLAGASFAAQGAQAQGFQATPTVVQGTVTIDDMVPGETRITVDGTDAVIDWVPNPNPFTGLSEIFLPDGNTGIFLGTADFAVLNRIIPDNANAPVRFDGLVQAFLTDGSGIPTGPGGFVAFYSPSGIIVGATGRFEVPQLMLTSQDVDLASFTDFANGAGSLFLSGDTGFVDMQAGATFTGTPEDSFMIIAAPQITMAGDAYYNGSIAYVATNAVQMTHSSGLFDIIILDGAPGGLTIDHSGSSGGPSSTGAGDEHVIYGVTAGGTSGAPVSMLFGGNLGFDPAVAVGVVNGDIILSANYDVAGRTVDGDDNRQGADSFFDGRSVTSSVQADILLSGVAATSNLLAIATGQTNLDVTSASSSFDGDLALVGRQQAVVTAGAGEQLNVGGDLFVSARNFGLNSPITSEEDAAGGFASVSTGSGGQITVAGQTMVAASALPGINLDTNTIGIGTGGQAQILAESGIIELTGDVRLEAYAFAEQPAGTFDGSGAMTGGEVQFIANFGGTLTAQGGLTIDVGAETPDIATSDGTAIGAATGGDILIGHGSGGGTTSVAGDVIARANGVVAASDIVELAVATATGGNVQISAIDAGGVDLQGSVTLDASAFGGAVIGGGDAGQVIGGTTAVNLAGGDLTVGGQLILDSSALASGGFNGGAAQGGFADIIANDGALSVGGNLTVSADAQGGSVTSSGVGGSASSGDIVLLAGPAGQIIVAGTGVSALGSTATGGSSFEGAGGTASGGSTAAIADGAGGAITFADSLSQNGAAIGGNSQDGAGGNAAGGQHIAAAQNGGILTITGQLAQNAQVDGGVGAVGGAAIGADLGLFSGTGSQINLGSFTASGAAFGGDGLAGDGGEAFGANIAVELDGGLISLAGTVNLASTGTGGASTGGLGGAGFGGDVQFENGSGVLSAGGTALTISSSGIGGDALTAGQQAGDGRGGDVSFDTFGAATSTLDSFNVSADGLGGTGPDAIGGSGTGGTASASVSGSASQLIVAGASSVSSLGTGGVSAATGSTGGAGTSGSASIAASNLGDLQAAGTLTVRADSSGGAGFAAGGAATGGDASIVAQGGGSIAAAELNVSAGGLGGDAPAGGDGLGGVALVQADAATLSISGGTQIEANGRGGEGAMGGAAGNGFGGNSSLLISPGGDASFGADSNVTASGEGGIGIEGASGGEGEGGSAAISVENGILTSSAGISARAHGTGGVGTGSGGGTGGNVTLSAAENAVLDALSLSGSASGFGANSVDGDGGSALGGDASFLVDNVSAATIGNIVRLESVAAGGDSELVGGVAGSASSGAVTLTLTDSGTLNAVQTQLLSNAIGGSEAGAATGVVGADAVSGAVNVNVTNSTLTSALNASSIASGGASTSADGGSAIAGDVLLTTNGLLDLTGTSLLASDAVGGTGTGGGAATSGDATGNLVDSFVNGGALEIRSSAQGGNGGDALAGDVLLATTGSGSLDLAALTLNSNADGAAGAIAISGTAELDVEFGLATITDLALNTDTGGDADGTPGQVLLTSTSAVIDTDTITMSAQGLNPGAEAQISASDGGQISALTSLDAVVTGDIAMTTVNGGGITGGSAPDNLTATFDVLAGGIISLDGDDASIRSIKALDSTFTSADIAVGADTQFGGGNVTLVSIDTAEQAVLGGSTAGAGYSLLQDEAGAISSDTLSIVLPDVVGVDIDAVVNDLAFIGTGAAGFSRVEISVDGSLDIIGALALESAGAGDVLALSATEQVQITLPTGSIALTDGSALAGILQVDASRIVAADAALIAQIAADPTSQAVADALLDDGGAAAAFSFITADRVELIASDLVLTQNTGANDVYGGITVGAGGLLITQTPGAPELLQVIAFGLQDIAGIQTTNDDWFALVEFATAPASTYTAAATFNDCIIATGTCPNTATPTPTPNEPAVPTTNHTLIEEPLVIPEITENGAANNFQFGSDFPSLLDSALIIEDDLIDEPVTSGGDSAVQALTPSDAADSDGGAN